MCGGGSVGLVCAVCVSICTYCSRPGSPISNTLYIAQASSFTPGGLAGASQYNTLHCVWLTSPLQLVSAMLVACG